jgi:hypothetical protein
VARLLACSLKVKAERDKADARPVIGPRSPSGKIKVGMGVAIATLAVLPSLLGLVVVAGRRLRESLPPYMQRDAYDIGFKPQGSRYCASSSSSSEFKA